MQDVQPETNPSTKQDETDSSQEETQDDSLKSSGENVSLRSSDSSKKRTSSSKRLSISGEVRKSISSVQRTMSSQEQKRNSATGITLENISVHKMKSADRLPQVGEVQLSGSPMLMKVSSCSSMGKFYSPEPVLSKMGSLDKIPAPRNFKLGRKLKKKYRKGNTSLISTSDANLRGRATDFFSKETLTTQVLDCVFHLMGIGAKDSEVLIKSAMEHANQEQLKESSYSRSEIALTNTLLKRVKIISRLQEKQASVIKIQALARGFLVRKRVRAIDPKERQRLLKFNKYVAQLISCEEKYVNRLKILNSRYLRPLRQRIAIGKEILKGEDLNYIFGNLPAIKDLHQTSLEKLKLLTNNWPFVSGVGKVILDMRDGLQDYAIYVGNFKAAQAALLKIKAENSKFTAFLQETAQKHTDAMDLLTLLSVPLSHLETMEPILENLGESSRPGSNEEFSIKNAFTMFTETRKFVKAHLTSTGNVGLSSLERRFVGLTQPLLLVKPGRNLLNETVFTIAHKKHHVIMLTDMILICKPVKGKKDALRLVEQVDMDVAQFEQVLSDKNAFNIRTPITNYRVQGRFEDKVVWECLFKNYLQNKRKYPTFGLDFLKIVTREQPANGIPSIVTQCVEHIKNFPDGMLQEGIFRISAEQRELTELKNLFDNVPPGERNLTPYGLHAICGILKQFFRELPEPLLTFALYPKFIDLERKTDHCVKLNSEMISQLRGILQELGPRLPTLKYLIEFLTSVCKHSEVNKMTESNIAIVFGPTLLRPEEESLESSLNSPLVNQTIHRFLDHFSELFC